MVLFRPTVKLLAVVLEFVFPKLPNKVVLGFKFMAYLLLLTYKALALY